MEYNDVIKIIDGFVEVILDTSTNDSDQLQVIEKNYNCLIYFDVEKINLLQEIIHYDIEFDGIEDHLYLEIENGVNNGTCLRNSSWG